MCDIVSVIVPFYNTEKYISKCIDSIRNQTYRWIEIILVDDGSTDISKEIINNYMMIDARIKYFYQDNNGPAAARNKGIYEANGKYILFVDSDDWIDNDMIEDMLLEIKIKNGELVICDFILETDKKSIYNEVLFNFKGINVNQTKKLLVNSDILNSQCNRLYKKEIIDKYNIKFNEELIVGEDQIFNMEYVSYINNVVYINRGFYHYRMLTNSTCRKIHYNQVEMLEKQQKIRNKIITKWSVGSCEYKVESAKWFLQNIASYCYLASTTLDKEDTNILLRRLIMNETTKESLDLINNQKITYEANIHKIFIPLIKLGSINSLFLASKIYYFLNYLKNKIN